MRDLRLSKGFRFLINAFVLLISISGCKDTRKTADKIIIADKVYTCDSSYTISQAIAIENGLIIAVGTKDEITSSYETKEEMIYRGTLFPGFIDAHSHFYGYALTLNRVNLKNTTSMQDIVQKLIEYTKTTNEEWITGRGWDETTWESKGTISNNLLNAYFPERPVFIKRVDGHQGIANNKALELAGLDIDSKVDGGEIGKMGGRLTGVLIDNAMGLVDKMIPPLSRKSEISALLKAQEKCFEAGLTTVTDAGLDLDIILLIDSLQKAGDLKMRIYAMANPSEENFEYFEKNGPISNDKLQVSSFKLYADGSLGSRGAKLKESYCDHENYTGLWVTQPYELKQLCERINALDFQANTHCIGDSANKKTLEIYGSILKGKNDKRWRIEHAQVVTPMDRKLFEEYSILPSVQPTHATSDMVWADDRLCEDRMNGAYAYKSLLGTNGYLPLGTDFPVEAIYPLETYFAAVHRQDEEYKPLDGFLPQESLTPTEAILGMTSWAAKANRMDYIVGSIEVGKKADFVILDKDITLDKYMLKTKVIATYQEGNVVN
jgi:predicted amidohydrolase YtcJ